jgi:hypothetical protein
MFHRRLPVRHPLFHRLVHRPWALSACAALVKHKACHDDRHQREILPPAVTVNQYGSQQEIVGEEEAKKYKEFLPDIPQVVPFKAAAFACDDADIHAYDGTHKEHRPHHQIYDIFLS